MYIYYIYLKGNIIQPQRRENFAICNNMVETGEYHTKGNKPGTER